MCRCEDAERNEEDVKMRKKKSEERFPFPVFVVVCTKFKKMANASPVVEYVASDSSRVERLSGLDALKDRIKSVQHFALLCHQMTRENKLTDDNFIELMDPKSDQKTAKYRLYVVDRRRKTSNQFAAFVVPQGRSVVLLFIRLK